MWVKPRCFRYPGGGSGVGVLSWRQTDVIRVNCTHWSLMPSARPSESSPRSTAQAPLTYRAMPMLCHAMPARPCHSSWRPVAIRGPHVHVHEGTWGPLVAMATESMTSAAAGRLPSPSCFGNSCNSYWKRIDVVMIRTNKYDGQSHCRNYVVTMSKRCRCS